MQVIMKKSAMLIGLILTLIGYAKALDTPKIKYFLVDLNNKAYQVTTVKLNAGKLYQQQADVELFNIKTDRSLILFSVLPQKGKTLWKTIDFNTVLSDTVNYSAMVKLFTDGMRSSKQRNDRNISDYATKKETIKIVIRKDGQYMIPNYVITEYFNLSNEPVIFPNQLPNYIINIKAPALKALDFEQQYKALYNHYSANAVATASGGSVMLRPPFAEPRLFLSGKVDVAGYQAYQFWQFTDWRIVDGLNSYRGIDRFLYTPELGIIAGSFDYWFGFKMDSITLTGNYLAEKLMMPLEINNKAVAVP